jgi:hypothetical protein
MDRLHALKRAGWIVAFALFVPGGSLLALAALLANRVWRFWPTGIAGPEG